MAMGAELHRVPGTRQDTTDAAMAAAETRFYASHCWQPFFLEGTKTLAFELWEQMGFAVPDHVIMPAGQGGNILGLAIGFAELLAGSQIERIPRLHLVQAANCSPLVDMFEGREPRPVSPTVADGIASARPVRGAEIVQAVIACDGTMVRVSEEAIGTALRQLAAMGWYVEPTTAAGAAGLTTLMQNGTIQQDESTVLILTGHGLKAGQSIARILGA
ncbi:MAG TPA: pyridoxal-phosphate dependent enzyme, partial [Alphaproteobacteria bacterium]|nr:pyridoxal-phosphate dependent enzyme [Alphaproteobacteria bacterium]